MDVLSLKLELGLEIVLFFVPTLKGLKNLNPINLSIGFGVPRSFEFLSAV